MTILNVDEIEQYGITEQPIEYNSEEELIKWLKYDLLQQAKSKIENKDKKIITIKDEEEKDYTLNIGYVDKISFEIDINFIFSIHSIINKLSNNQCKSTIIINYVIFAQNVCFKKLSSFAQIQFNNILIFNFSKFNKDVTFIGSHFKKKCEFLFAYFYEKADFTFTNLYDKFDISVSKLYNAFIFDSSNFYNKSYINFERITFEHSDSIIKIIGNKDNNKIYKLNFSYIDILNKIYIENIEVEEADFKGSVINGGLVNPVNFKVHKFANRESALFLKQQAYARNNAIDALEYKSKEVEKHKEDLIKDWKNNKNLKTLGDILSIELSSLYSDNGQNWIKALAMTILITAFCFTIFYMPDVFYIDKIFNEENYISLYFSSYKNVFNNLIKYLIPTDYDLIKDYTKLYINYSNTPLCDIITYLAVKIFGVLVYFLGKVLFWYGSVQTVQAFRKFAKGA
ncbi:hypothetical protein OFR22_11180 [Brachyspira hyodysenteriae]|uniref:hypothetical protein n=1 Tax=Brachyspira hyodysenteriae TaxID=159 RepID=UPI0022CDBA16|nr:hypothetical protein [Brachyspira hyodysenteriae]MCZ9840232.1 hypothetical protein [Brachyspira hyodysenteriae]MCZ9848620.1 hypothetical protein [Brachyspira hyodysenteriae]MCZ9850638.1 hypothetical protein [Brachyspira hyodysenteriae]MCZ9860609.1 hypothetical protein [Brachyspira hyodysenteriae]MCZ9869889.1 hypothetical protein [Brachyspira hyodysenteriae]